MDVITQDLGRMENKMELELILKLMGLKKQASEMKAKELSEIKITNFVLIIIKIEY